MSAAPPRLSISSNTRTVVLPYGLDINVNVLRKDLFMSDIFSFSPNVGLTFQYQEGRINFIKVYWQSDNATADAGSVCLNVEDYGENNGSDTCAFVELLTYPGSMVRKVWQGVSNRWYPTEPSDREFRSLTSASGVLTFTVRHSVAASKLKGRIIMNISVTLRGKTTKRATAFEQFLESEGLVAEMDMVYVTDQSASCA